MFLSKNDLVSIEEQLNKLTRKVDELSKKPDYHGKLDKIDEKIILLTNKLLDMEKSKSLLSSSIAKDAELLKDLSDQLRRRVVSFKLLEDKASKKLFEDANAQINEKLQSLFYTTREYKKLEESLGQINNKIMQMSKEIDKFNDIANKIKASDFELANYAREVTKMDHEKLRLIRENENLKRIISKERRNH